MVYTFQDWGNGAGFMASPVAPPVHPEVKDRDIIDMTVAHFHIDDPERIGRMLGALERLGDQDLENARMQVHHLLDMVRSQLDNLRFRHPMAVSRPEDVVPAIKAAIEGIAADADGLLGRVEDRPKDKGAITGLGGALETLAEAVAYAGHVRDANPGDLAAYDLADEAAARLDALLERSDRLRTAVGPLYDHLPRLLPTSDGIRAAAGERFLAQAAIDGTVLVPEKVERTRDLTGDRSLLWLYSQPNTDRGAKVGASIRKLTPSETVDLRTRACEILEAYRTTFLQPGFIALLRQGAVLSRWRGLGRIADAHDSGIEVEMRETHKRMRGRDDDLKEALAKLPGERLRWAREGKAEVAAGLLFDTIVDGVNHRAGAAAKPVFLLRTDEATKVVVGSFPNRPDADVIAIYPDPYVNRQGAVFAVTLSPGELGAGLPPLDDLKGEAWHDGPRKGTNYYSLEQALGCLAGGDMHTQTFFFAEPVSVLDETDLRWEPPAPSVAPAPVP